MALSLRPWCRPSTRVGVFCLISFLKVEISAGVQALPEFLGVFAIVLLSWTAFILVLRGAVLVIIALAIKTGYVYRYPVCLKIFNGNRVLAKSVMTSPPNSLGASQQARLYYTSKHKRLDIVVFTAIATLNV